MINCVGNKGVLPGWAEKRGVGIFRWPMMMRRNRDRDESDVPQATSSISAQNVLPDTVGDREAGTSPEVRPAVPRSLP